MFPQKYRAPAAEVISFMKKIFFVLIAALFCIFAVSCGGGAASGADTADGTADGETTAISAPDTTDADTSDTEAVSDTEPAESKEDDDINGTLELADRNADGFTGLLAVYDSCAYIYADTDSRPLLYTLTYPEGLVIVDASRRFESCGTDDADMNGLTDIYIIFRDGDENGGRLVFLEKIENNDIVYEYSETYSTLLPPGASGEDSGSVGEPLDDTSFLEGFWYPGGDLGADRYYYFSSDGEWSLYTLSPGTWDPELSGSGKVFADADDPSRFYLSDSSGGSVGFRYDRASGMMIPDGEYTAYSNADAG